MFCIFCLNETEVINSRPKAKNPSVWRRRRCLACNCQFTAIELPDYAKALRVSKPGQKKPAAFSRDKLFLSMYRSLGHRPDAMESATALTATVIGRVLRTYKPLNGSLNALGLAKAAQEVLKRYDPAAAASYKAYHRTSLR